MECYDQFCSQNWGWWFSWDVLQTNIFCDEVENIIIDLKPLKQVWRKYICIIVSNGWSDLKKRSIINILTCFCKCTMFISVIDILRLVGQPHIPKMLEIVGLQNVVQVIIGNVFNCKAMDNLVTRETPQLFGHLVLPIVLIKSNWWHHEVALGEKCGHWN